MIFYYKLTDVKRKAANEKLNGGIHRTPTIKAEDRVYVYDDNGSRSTGGGKHLLKYQEVRQGAIFRCIGFSSISQVLD